MQRLLSKGIGHTDFKDSPLGEIPKEWEVVKLGEEAIIIMGQSPSGESYNKVGTGMPVLNGPTEFTNIHPIPVQFTTEVTKLASQGDILFCVRGSTTGRMNVADQTYCIGRGLAAIRGGENTSTKYIYYILQNLAKEVLRKAKDMGSTFPNVNSKELFQYKLALPSIDEQKKISDILNLSDQKLEILGERKEQMKEFKKGLMQKLLTGHIRVNSLLRKTEAS
ncbi:MAG: restriction endonuclease subunit S [Bacteroidota bacterium]